MEAVVLQTGCKANLTLRITGVHPNGWYELDTVFLSLVESSDTLRLALRPGGGLVLYCMEPGIDSENNTLIKAYHLFAEALGFRPDVEAVLEKGIPHGAELGGGSADVVALLGWLNACASEPLPLPELVGSVARIGASVPLFLYNIPYRASGIGERFAPCPERLDAAGVAGTGFILLCPRRRVSAPRAYAAWDEWNRLLTEVRNGAVNRASQKPLDGASSTHWLEDSFESPVFEAFPRFRRLRRQFPWQGALAAAMSDSGPSPFGFFWNAGTAFRVAEGFREKDVAAYSYVLQDFHLQGNLCHAGVWPSR